jgi:hypothetical protein
MTVDLKCCVLWLGEEDASLWYSRARRESFLLTLTNNWVILDWCKGVVTVCLEGLEAVKCLAEPILETSDQQGLYIDRMLVQAWQAVSVRVMNMRSWDQVLTRGVTMGFCERVMWAVPVDVLEPQIPGTQQLIEQLQKVMSGTRLNPQHRRSMCIGEVNCRIPGYFCNEERWMWADWKSFPLPLHWQWLSDPLVPA